MYIRQCLRLALILTIESKLSCIIFFDLFYNGPTQLNIKYVWHDQVRVTLYLVYTNKMSGVHTYMYMYIGSRTTTTNI